MARKGLRRWHSRPTDVDVAAPLVATVGPQAVMVVSARSSVTAVRPDTATDADTDAVALEAKRYAILTSIQ